MITLKTERLVLRDWHPDDCADLFEYAQNELVGPNAGWLPHKSESESLDIIRMFMSNDDVYAIELKESGKVIGSIGIHERKPDPDTENLAQREIGYVLNPEFWGNGYMPEAVKRVIEFGFQELNLDMFWCSCFDFNINSLRVIEKCGFKYQFKRTKRIRLFDDKEFTTLYHSLYNPAFKS
jgi:RimJ/RimL family protein N-acetyltransferase